MVISMMPEQLDEEDGHCNSAVSHQYSNHFQPTKNTFQSGMVGQELPRLVHKGKVLKHEEAGEVTRIGTWFW